MISINHVIQYNMDFLFCKPGLKKNQKFPFFFETLLEKVRYRYYIECHSVQNLQDLAMYQGKNTAIIKSAIIIADSFAFTRIHSICRISNIIII